MAPSIWHHPILQCLAQGGFHRYSERQAIEVSDHGGWLPCYAELPSLRKMITERIIRTRGDRDGYTL
jgi:hypothetical protein